MNLIHLFCLYGYISLFHDFYIASLSPIQAKLQTVWSESLETGELRYSINSPCHQILKTIIFIELSLHLKDILSAGKNIVFELPTFYN